MSDNNGDTNNVPRNNNNNNNNNNNGDVGVSPAVRNVLIAGATTVGGLVLAPVVVGGVLGAVGFGAAGPIAGSIAAGIQAGIGNVAAGSAFATLQSIAMGGALAGPVNAGIGLVLGGLGYFGLKRKGDITDMSEILSQEQLIQWAGIVSRCIGYVAKSDTPWVIETDALCGLIQAEWDDAFPDVPFEIVVDGLPFKQTRSAILQWRRMIIANALAVVEKEFHDLNANTPRQRGALVTYLLGDGETEPFVCLKLIFIEDRHRRHWSAMFMTRMILRAFAYHLFLCWDGVLDIAQRPVGALALVTASVYCALLKWRQGERVEVTPLQYELNIKTHTPRCLPAVTELGQSEWEQILSGAMEYVNVRNS